MSLLEISIVLLFTIIFIITALIFAFIIREIGILRRERDEAVKNLRKEKHRLINKLQIVCFRSELNERDIKEIKAAINLPSKPVNDIKVGNYATVVTGNENVLN